MTKPTTKAEQLVAFLAVHGPARHIYGWKLQGEDGFTFRINKAWLARYMLDGVVRTTCRRTPKGIIQTWYDVPDDTNEEADR